MRMGRVHISELISIHADYTLRRQVNHPRTCAQFIHSKNRTEGYLGELNQ